MSDFIIYEFYNNSIIDIHSNTKYSLLQLLTLLSFDPLFFVYLDNKTNDCDNDTYCFKPIEISNKIMKKIMKNLKELIENTKEVSQNINIEEYKKYVTWFCDHELNSLNSIINDIKNNPDVNHYYIENKSFIFKKEIPFIDSYFDCLIPYNSNPYWIEYKKINNELNIDYRILLNENEFIKQLLESILIIVAKNLILTHNDLDGGRNSVWAIHKILIHEKSIRHIEEMSDFIA